MELTSFETLAKVSSSVWVMDSAHVKISGSLYNIAAPKFHEVGEKTLTH